MSTCNDRHVYTACHIRKETEELLKIQCKKEKISKSKFISRAIVEELQRCGYAIESEDNR